MESMFVTSQMVFNSLCKLYRIGGCLPVSYTNLITYLRQNGFGDEWTGSLEAQLNAILHQLTNEHKIISPNPGYFVPRSELRMMTPPPTPNQSPNRWPPLNFHKPNFDNDKWPNFSSPYRKMNTPPTTPLTSPYYRSTPQPTTKTAQTSEKVYEPWLKRISDKPSTRLQTKEDEENEDEDEDTDSFLNGYNSTSAPGPRSSSGGTSSSYLPPTSNYLSGSSQPSEFQRLSVKKSKKSNRGKG